MNMAAELFLYGALGLAGVVYWILWTQPFGSGWLPMPAAAIRKGMEKAGLKRGDVLFDLGCGDGRVIKQAAGGCKWAVGFEMDPIRYCISKARCRQENTRIVFGNFFKKPLDEADVVFAYLHPKTNKRLAKKLRQECRKGTRVVSYWWQVPGLQEIWKDDKARLYVYRI